MALSFEALARSCAISGLLLVSACGQGAAPLTAADGTEPEAAREEPEAAPVDEPEQPEAAPVDEPEQPAALPESAHQPEPSQVEPKVAVDAPSEPVVVQPAAPVHTTPKQPTLPPLPPLPAATLGACVFLPVSETTTTTDNLHCPDGTWHGDAQISTEQNLQELAGCTRITGALRVYSTFVSSIEALRALRVVESDLVFSDWSYEGTPQRGPVNLTGVHGLENLACVGGQLTWQYSAAPKDGATLESLVEVGGDLSLGFAGDPGLSLSLPALRRVWGNLSVQNDFTAPQLESVYGSMTNASSSAEIYVGCAGDTICRDGVLGCDYYADDQAKLDKLSNCEIAVHGLTLPMSDLHDLSPLAKLRYVAGRLDLSGVTDGSKPAAQATSLAGLNALRTVRELNISGLPELSSLDALSDLAWVGPTNLTRLNDYATPLPYEHPQYPGPVSLQHLPKLDNLRAFSRHAKLGLLQIADCDALRDLTGLDALQSGAIAIGDSANFRSLNGAPQLRHAESIWLEHLPLLTDISAVSALDSTRIYLTDLPLLANLHAFSGVEITGVVLRQLPLVQDLSGLEHTRAKFSSLEITENAALTNIDALAQVRELYFLTIENNPVLKSVHALDELHYVKYAARIDSNPLLPACELQPIASLAGTFLGGGNDTQASCNP